MAVEGGGGEDGAVGGGDDEFQGASVVVEVFEFDGVEAFGEGFLADYFTRAVGTVVVDHGVAVDGEDAAVVAEEGEGVDAVGGNVDVAGDDEADVALAVSGDLDVGDGECGLERRGGDFGALLAGIVIPFGGEARLCGRYFGSGAV